MLFSFPTFIGDRATGLAHVTEDGRIVMRNDPNSHTKVTNNVDLAVAALRAAFPHTTSIYVWAPDDARTPNGMWKVDTSVRPERYIVTNWDEDKYLIAAVEDLRDVSAHDVSHDIPPSDGPMTFSTM